MAAWERGEGLGTRELSFREVPPSLFSTIYLLSVNSIGVRAAKPVPPTGQLGILRVTNSDPAMSRCTQLPSNVINYLRNTATLLTPPARTLTLTEPAVLLLGSPK